MLDAHFISPALKANALQGLTQQISLTFFFSNSRIFAFSCRSVLGQLIDLTV